MKVDINPYGIFDMCCALDMRCTLDMLPNGNANGDLYHIVFARSKNISILRQ